MTKLWITSTPTRQASLPCRRASFRVEASTAPTTTTHSSRVGMRPLHLTRSQSPTYSPFFFYPELYFCHTGRILPTKNVRKGEEREQEKQNQGERTPQRKIKLHVNVKSKKKHKQSTWPKDQCQEQSEAGKSCHRCGEAMPPRRRNGSEGDGAGAEMKKRYKVPEPEPPRGGKRADRAA